MYRPVGLHEPLKGTGAVRGAGRGQRQGRKPRARPDVGLVKAGGPPARRKDGADVRRREDRREIVGDGVLDARVRRALDVAGGEHVPQRDPPPQGERALFRDRLGRGLVQRRGERPPESVLRVAVIEALLPRLGGGHRPEDEHAGARVIDGRDGMYDVRGHGGRLPFRVMGCGWTLRGAAETRGGGGMPARSAGRGRFASARGGLLPPRSRRPAPCPHGAPFIPDGSAPPGGSARARGRRRGSG